jgi:glc operon protein GlcG
MDTISLKQANELLRLAAEKSSADYKRPICAAICDASGFFVSFQRMDGAPLRSIAIAQGKAYSAARMQLNTDAFLARIRRDNISAAYFCDDKIIALPGGSVLKNAAGEIIGSVGISGLTSEEDQIIANYLAGLVAEGNV